MILRPFAATACAALALTALGGCNREATGAFTAIALIVPCGTAQREAMTTLQHEDAAPNHSYAAAVAPLDRAKQVCSAAATRIRNETLFGERSREFAEAMDIQAVGLGEMADGFRYSPTTPPSRNSGFQTGLGHVREGLEMLQQIRSRMPGVAAGDDAGPLDADSANQGGQKS